MGGNLELDHLPPVGELGITPLPPGVSAGDIQAELRRILSSKGFAHSNRLRQFLEFVVNCTVEARPDRLKEYVIALEIFGRKDSFDPKQNAIVRVEAGRLRSRIQEYYNTEGRQNPLRVEFRKGSYVPSFRRPARTPIDAREPAALAVLPFANMTGDPKDEYLSDGLTEEIISSLGRIEGLRVVGRTSVFRFRERSLGPREIGERLKVRAILDGSVRRSGGRLRITAQLINVADGCQLSSDKYECAMKDVFDVQDKISEKIVEALKVRLMGGAVPSVYRPRSVAAYNFYLKGRYQQARRTPEGLRKSVANFQHAIALDCGLAAAYSGLAESYSIMGLNELLPAREVISKARSAARQALSLDYRIAAAHACLGDVLSVYEWAWDHGEEEFQRAIRLDPSDAMSRSLYASSSLAPRQRWHEALAEMRRALNLEPVSALMSRDLGLLLFLKRDYVGAIEQFRATQDLDPDFIGIYYWLGRAYAENRMPTEALSAFELRLRWGQNTRVLAAIGRLHAETGNRPKALAVLRKLEQFVGSARVPPLDLVTLHIGLGQACRALDFLEHAFAERSPALYQLAIDPLYDPLRGHSRFKRLLEKMGLQ
jgi:TolB-like protein